MSVWGGQWGACSGWEATSHRGLPPAHPPIILNRSAEEKVMACSRAAPMAG